MKTCSVVFGKRRTSNIRGRSDKYLASPPKAPLSQEKYTIVWYILVDVDVVLFWPRVKTAVPADFTKMEKEQHRLVILFLFLEAKSRSGIKERFDGDRQKLV